MGFQEIEQIQYTGAESFSNSAVKTKLALNHPCKELVWVIQPDANVDGGENRWADYTDGATDYAGGDTLQDARLQLNGHDRFSTRKAGYFNLVIFARQSDVLMSVLVPCY